MNLSDDEIAQLLARPADALDELDRLDCEESLLAFTRQHWSVLEPATPMIQGWPMQAVCEHLEAVTAGHIQKLLINVPPGFSKPVHVDEPVYTRRGYVRLGDIVVGDKVLTHRGRFRRVTAVHDQGLLEVVEVKTGAGRRVVAAPDHPFLTDRGWVAAGDLNPRHYVCHVRPTVDVDHPNRFSAESVASVTHAGVAECRCLTVEDDHSFTANGLAVHNSLITNVFWPAWEWGARDMAHLRVVSFSYSSILTQRDNRRFRDVLLSHKFARLFGDRFSLHKAGEQLITNDKTGWKLATSIGGVGTGERGDRVTLDDPNNIKDSESDGIREETNRWVREGMSNRLNDPDRSSIVVIQQRTHEQDVSGLILSEMRHDFEHLLIPMEWEGRRLISTVPDMTWTEDPRTEIGDLAWPQRFSPVVVKNLKITVGPYAWSGQYQQTPSPRGGGIIKRDWWQLWPDPDGYGTDPAVKSRFPTCDFVVASFDGAFGQRQENDYSALTVWGVFRENPGGVVQPTHYLQPHMELGRIPVVPERYQQRRFGAPKVILMAAWQKRLPLNGGPFPEREVGEDDASYARRTMSMWGITEWISHTCQRFRVNVLLIEAKANGIDVGQEMKRQHAGEGYGIRLVDPHGLDKVARAYAVQHLFADEMVYAPDREWADDVITQCAQFPKGKDDLVDTATQALKFLRDTGMLKHAHEMEREQEQAASYHQEPRPLYPT